MSSQFNITTSNNISSELSIAYYLGIELRKHWRGSELFAKSFIRKYSTRTLPISRKFNVSITGEFTHINFFHGDGTPAVELIIKG